MKNDICRRHFLVRKNKYILLSVTIVGILFVSYQLFYFKELNRVAVNTVVVESSVPEKIHSKWDDPQHAKLLRDSNKNTVSLRGTRDQDISKYLPNSRGKFVCFASKEEIEYQRINDDYCDCPLDGSDEPGTNACNNGTFHCEITSLHSKVAVNIPSYRVNDGFCDCCDGSDEWAEVHTLNVSLEKRDQHQPPCPQTC